MSYCDVFKFESHGINFGLNSIMRKKCWFWDSTSLQLKRKSFFLDFLLSQESKIKMWKTLEVSQWSWRCRSWTTWVLAPWVISLGTQCLSVQVVNRRLLEEAHGNITNDNTSQLLSHLQRLKKNLLMWNSATTPGWRRPLKASKLRQKQTRFEQGEENKSNDFCIYKFHSTTIIEWCILVKEWQLGHWNFQCLTSVKPRLVSMHLSVSECA